MHQQKVITRIATLRDAPACPVRKQELLLSGRQEDRSLGHLGSPLHAVVGSRTLPGGEVNILD